MFLAGVELLPLCAIAAYLVEKQRQEIYKEKCMYYMAAPNIAEKYRDTLKPLYLERAESARQRQAKNEPYRTKEEALNYIFEGI